ncbi:MAG: hypothetical protein JO190_12000 [Candidatus Eremiobacteraeota bacterium]|nr:hypothetical protein [Candidatus Eremiobacteraeota bacterium]
MHTLSIVAMLVAIAQPATRLSIQPWTGTDLQTTTAEAAKYRLEVTGPPNATIRLQASNVATGWLAAFCTPKLCSPQRLDAQLPRSGQIVLQFELIRESQDAPKHSGATITGGDGASVTVPAAYRQ